MVNCSVAETQKTYENGVWYLNLATTTRYADVKGRTKTSTELPGLAFKNLMCFVGPYVVMHLGTVETAHTDQFVVFDRIHTHRVLWELTIGRNSVRVEACASRRGNHSSFRARWVSYPSTGGSPLFH